MQGKMTEKQIFANNLRYLLKRDGLNYKDFAEAINIKYTTVLDWVNGRTFPRIEKLEIIAKYFAVQKSELLDGQMPTRISVLDLENLMTQTLTAVNKAENICYKEMKLEKSQIDLITSTLTQVLAFLDTESVNYKKRQDVLKFLKGLTDNQQD